MNGIKINLRGVEYFLSTCGVLVLISSRKIITIVMEMFKAVNPRVGLKPNQL